MVRLAEASGERVERITAPKNGKKFFAVRAEILLDL